MGLSSGLVIGWNTKFDYISNLVLGLSVMVDVYVKKLGKELRLINVYPGHMEIG